ncbi:MAG: AAA family ATPase [Acidobacteriota bacterium]
MTETMSARGETEALIGELKSLMAARNWGQRRLAEMLGVSQSTISQWLQGKYQAQEVMDRRVAEFLHERKSAGEGVVAAEGYRLIQEIATQCLEECKFGVIQGNPGTGKTKALQLFAQEHDQVVYVRADVTTNLKVLLEELARAEGGGLTNAQLMREARARCKGQLVIVDEADLLPVRCLEALRAIWGDGGWCGLILAGTPKLERLLRRGPHANENLAQLYSRVDFNALITNPTPVDLEQYLDAAQVEDPEARRMIIAEGTRGSFRAAAKLLNQARRVARLNGQPTVTGAAVRAARQLIMPAHAA